MRNLLLKSAALVLFAFGSSAAQAVGYCVGGTSTEDITVNDVTFRANSADDCYGVVNGNNTANAINNITNWFDPSRSWTELVKIDAPATQATGSFAGLSFTLDATNFNPATNSGAFTLSWSDPDPISIPTTLDFVAVLKGGNEYAAYLFTGELINVAPDSSSGTWQIVFQNKGGNIPDISHMSLYVRQGISTVPEPATVGLLGLGLLGLGAICRRKLLS